MASFSRKVLHPTTVVLYNDRINLNLTAPLIYCHIITYASYPRLFILSFNPIEIKRLIYRISSSPGL